MAHKTQRAKSIMDIKYSSSCGLVLAYLKLLATELHILWSIYIKVLLVNYASLVQLTML